MWCMSLYIVLREFEGARARTLVYTQIFVSHCGSASHIDTDRVCVLGVLEYNVCSENLCSFSILI